MTRDDAEMVAIAALSWMAEDPEGLGAFLSASGMTPQDLRSRAVDPAFLGAVLDHVMSRDDWVCAVADRAGIAPDAMVAVRAALPGGDLPHWT